jgi:tetratricopeptide (TPR) repeat protein
MPFGSKKDPSGGPDIDFDQIYENGIRPAIAEAAMEPVRADEERVGGVIHRAMFERLLLCDFAVADLTTANANVFYELGVRHAVRPATTLTIFAEHQRLPFDVNYLRSLPYRLAEGNRFTSDVASRLRETLAARLSDLRELSFHSPAPDSPIFQLLGEYQAPDIARLKTDSFREQVDYSARIKGELAEARSQKDPEALGRVEASLGSLDSVEAGVLVDLFLSYRALSRWDRMIALYERLPETLARTVMIREQHAFALNRIGKSDQALRELEQLVEDRGASSETNGLIGRVYKDRFVASRSEGSGFAASGNLDRAIAAYVRGFEADWRDAYPGVNAVTLLDIKGDPESKARLAELLPVVRFAVTQRLRSAKPDYWDHATLLELAVLASDRDAASKTLADALVAVRESWEPETTANNLKLIREARATRDELDPWVDEVIAELENKAGK